MNATQSPAHARGFRRLLYAALALFFLGIGLLGVVLPGLPTTPFLLLMSYFLIRSSPRLHDRVVQLPIIGGPIRDWREHQGVRTSVKLTACVMVLVLLVFSLGTSTMGVPLKVVTFGCAACGLCVICRLPSLTGQ